MPPNVADGVVHLFDNTVRCPVEPLAAAARFGEVRQYGGVSRRNRFLAVAARYGAVRICGEVSGGTDS